MSYKVLILFDNDLEVTLVVPQEEAEEQGNVNKVVFKVFSTDYHFIKRIRVEGESFLTKETTYTVTYDVTLESHRIFGERVSIYYKFPKRSRVINCYIGLTDDIIPHYIEISNVRATGGHSIMFDFVDKIEKFTDTKGNNLKLT